MHKDSAGKQNPAGKLNQFRESPVYVSLTPENRAALEHLASEEHLSVQQLRQLIDVSRDLQMWGCGPFAAWVAELPPGVHKSKQRAAGLTARLLSKWEDERRLGPDYTGAPGYRKPVSQHIVSAHSPEIILGDCPVASVKTRCCNLQTLDAAINCGFGCSYCTIQSFYDEGRIFLHTDLAAKLAKLEFDPEKTYHIGTGQSSDSLMWGNREGLLETLFTFASDNPNVILELKTKSANVGYLLENPPPPNVLATWTLNSPEVIQHEEHGTASLEERINAARLCADAGILTGFHFHPIIRHQGWKNAYARVFRRLVESFTPKEVALTSFGTLTYIKPVIREIRERGEPTQVLRLPLTETAGKFSYATAVKEEIFRFAYESFRPWHGKVFFYMCMEEPELWQPVFGFSYPDNDAFEDSMKSAYLEKIRIQD